MEISFERSNSQENEEKKSPLKSPHLLLKERLNNGQKQLLEKENNRLSTVNEADVLNDTLGSPKILHKQGITISETQASG